MELKRREILLLVMAKIAQIGLGLIALRVMTEALNTTQLGAYYVFMTTVGLLAFGFFNPIGQYFGRHIVLWKQQGKLKTAVVVLILARTLATPPALFLALMIFYQMGYSKYFEARNYTILLLATMIAMLHGVLLSAANVIVGRILFSVISVATLVSSLAVSVLMTKISPTAEAWLYGPVVGQLFFTCLLYKKITSQQSFSWQAFKVAINFSSMRSVALFTVPVTLTLLLQWAQLSSFRLFVEKIYSAEALAFIALGMTVSGAFFSAVESLLSQYYMPSYLERITNGSRSERALAWDELSNLVLPIYCGLAAYVIFFSPFLVNLLLSEKFQNVYIYTMIGACVEFFRVTTNLIYLVSQSEIKPARTVWPYVFGCLLMAASLALLHDTTHIWMIPSILAFSYAFTLVLMFWAMRKLLPISIDLRGPLKILAVMLPGAVVCQISVEQNLVFSVLISLAGGVYLLAALYYLIKLRIKIVGRL